MIKSYYRQSRMELNIPYFYTQKINKFQYLFDDEACKWILMDCLRYLVTHKFIQVYAFVIMPNHIHLVLRILSNRPKESTAASFSKYTSHKFREHLQLSNVELLEKFKLKAQDRIYRFWKRDPFAIPLTSESALLQKMNYIHNNPLGKKWNLVEFPEQYKWSSANYYKNGIDEFNFLTDYRVG